MGLSYTDRGMIEKLIDGAITDMSSTVNFIRNYRYSKILKEKDGNDFVLGYVIGRIDTTFKAEVFAQDRVLTSRQGRNQN